MAVFLFFGQSFNRRSILNEPHNCYLRQKDIVIKQWPGNTHKALSRGEQTAGAKSIAKKIIIPYKNSEECLPSLTRPRLVTTYRLRPFGEMEIAMPQTLLIEPG